MESVDPCTLVYEYVRTHTPRCPAIGWFRLDFIHFELGRKLPDMMSAFDLRKLVYEAKHPDFEVTYEKIREVRAEGWPLELFDSVLLRGLVALYQARVEHGRESLNIVELSQAVNLAPGTLMQGMNKAREMKDVICQPTNVEYSLVLAPEAPLWVVNKRLAARPGRLTTLHQEAYGNP